MAGGDAGDFEWNDEEGDASCAWAASSDGCSAVVGVDAVGDPLLGAGYDVVVALAGCCSFNSRYVRASFAFLARIDQKFSKSTHHLAR